VLIDRWVLDYDQNNNPKQRNFARILPSDRRRGCGPGLRPSRYCTASSTVLSAEKGLSTQKDPSRRRPSRNIAFSGYPEIKIAPEATGDVSGQIVPTPVGQFYVGEQQMHLIPMPANCSDGLGGIACCQHPMAWGAQDFARHFNERMPRPQPEGWLDWEFLTEFHKRGESNWSLKHCSGEVDSVRHLR
jgi:hypothetical protein